VNGEIMAKPMTSAQIRAAMTKWHVQVREFPGWTARKRPGAFTDIRGIIIHHTGSDAQSDSYLDWIFTEGRASEGIPAPLCHVSTDMDGDLWLGAIGRANHAGKGSSSTLAKVTAENYSGFASEITGGLDNTDGNAHFYGNEVRYDGGQPMTAKQYASAVRWAAAICDHYGWSALSVIGHREWSRRKPDPGKCPMNKFRSDVAALLKAGPGGVKPPTGNKPTTPTKETDMPLTPDETAKLNKAAWLADQFAYDGSIMVKLNDIVNRLQRIEDDTDTKAAD
jgi:hypothetical protein